jgi:hypothetical protein
MSTRSVLARVEGDGFVGRYAHCDGYPTARGKELFESYRQLGEDAEMLRQYAIREGESGYWSSYKTPDEYVASPDRSTPEGEAAFQSFNYPHGWTPDGEGGQLINSNGDNWGTEWAYVIADKGLSVFENRYRDGDYKKPFWYHIGTYKWDEEPDWAKVEATNDEEDA